MPGSMHHHPPAQTPIVQIDPPDDDGLSEYEYAAELQRAGNLSMEGHAAQQPTRRRSSVNYRLPVEFSRFPETEPYRNTRSHTQSRSRSPIIVQACAPTPIKQFNPGKDNVKQWIASFELHLSTSNE